MNTNQRFAVLALGFILVVSTACWWDDDDPTGGTGTRRIIGSGVMAEETRSVSGFNALTLATVGHVHVEQGTQERLRVEAEDNLLPYLLTDVDSGVLVISEPAGVDLQPNHEPQFYLTVVSLETVLHNGVGRVEMSDLNPAGKVRLRMMGVGDIRCSGLEADTLDVRLTGVGDVRVSGNVDNQEITLSGVGDFEAQSLATTETIVMLSGVGDATVCVSDRLVATVTGAGTVYYYGDPLIVEGTALREGPGCP